MKGALPAVPPPSPPLTHDVQNVVRYLGGCDGALFGVRLQDLQHGLQLVQSTVLTLLADELPTHRLEDTPQINNGEISGPDSHSSKSTLAHRALSQSGGGLLDVADGGQVESGEGPGDVVADPAPEASLDLGHSHGLSRLLVLLEDAGFQRVRSKSTQAPVLVDVGPSYLVEDRNKSERQLADLLEVSLIQHLFEFGVYQVRQPMRKAAVLRGRVWEHNLDGPGRKHTVLKHSSPLLS